MIEWIVTSSVLIAAIVAIRLLTKKRLSARLRYCIWLLVLLRLLIPVSIPSSISIMNALPDTQPEQSFLEQTILFSPAPALPSFDSEIPDIPTQSVTNNTQQQDPYIEQNKINSFSLQQIAVTVWILGMIVMSCTMIVCNIHFAIRLKRTRKKLDVPNIPVPVYVCSYIKTPCLFGISRPSIYLTADLNTPETLNHVLTHERTHLAHADHIWSFLRCVCLILHWYNPFVWLGAFLSRQDGELACDEASIRTLGEDQRTAYGKTLIEMACIQHDHTGIFTAATTMLTTKKSLKERISMIARKPKTAIFALVVVLLIASVIVGCTFTGAEKQTDPSEEDKIIATDIFDSTIYIYEGEGFGGRFFIRFSADNTYTYSVGLLSSYYGVGGWRLDGQLLTMADTTGLPFTNRFRVEENTLVWIAESSDGFMYLELEDGAKFFLTGEASAEDFLGEVITAPDDPMIGGLVNIDGVGYQYVKRHEGALPAGFSYKGTIYRDNCGVPSGDYAASILPGGSRVYTNDQEPNTVYVCEPENYGAEYTLKLTRLNKNSALPCALSQEELQNLQNVLSWGGYLRVLNVPFTNIEHLDLYRLINMGAAIDETPLTQEEYAYVESQWGALAQSPKAEEVLRVPATSLNAFLDQYYGYSLENFSSEHLARVSLNSYLADTDAYYVHHHVPYQNPQSITVTSAVRTGGKLYVRYLRQGKGYVASLWEIDSRYVCLNILPEG